MAPGVTRNARGASGKIRSRGSGGAEGNPPTPSASPGRGGASGRTRSRGSGGTEGDTPIPSASPRKGGASGRMGSRGSGGAEGNPPTRSASPGRGGASGRIRSRGSGGAEGDTPTPSASLRRGGASGRICSCGHRGAEGNPPTPSVPPGRVDFGGINGNSSSYSSEDSRTSSGNEVGDFPALARRPARDLEAFGELPALQSGHTGSQSRGLAMGASCADDLLAYAMRVMEDEKPMEEKAAEVERAHDCLLEEQLE